MLMSVVLAGLVFVLMPCTVTSARSEEHTSELQSQSNLVCRLLLEKKKKISILCSVLQSRTPHFKDHDRTIRSPGSLTCSAFAWWSAPCPGSGATLPASPM